jgi:hypothetical protein
MPMLCQALKDARVFELRKIKRRLGQLASGTTLCEFRPGPQAHAAQP